MGLVHCRLEEAGPGRPLLFLPETIDTPSQAQKNKTSFDLF
jgi:hypothetical protein